jgi:hypothetical protein
LSSESSPGDIYGTQRQSFWICGIVARPANTTPKTSAIHPRNPLIQQTQHSYHMPQQAAQSSSRLQGFSPSTHYPARPHEPAAAYPSLPGYRSAPVHSFGPAPTSGSYATHTASRPSTHIPLESAPVSHGHRNGTDQPVPASRNSLSGYVATQQSPRNSNPARADYPPTQNQVPSATTHATTHAPSHRYMVPASQPSMIPPQYTPSRPVLPPPPDMPQHYRDHSATLAPSAKSHYPSPSRPQNGLPPLRDQHVNGSGSSARASDAAPR